MTITYVYGHDAKHSYGNVPFQHNEHKLVTCLLKKYKKDVISWFSVFVINVTSMMLHCQICCYYYYNVEFECVFLLFLEWDVSTIHHQTTL
jgi:hypothetical protein